MVGPQRKQRKPIVVKQSGTAYKTHTEQREVNRKWMTKILPSEGTRKKPLLLQGKSVEKTEELTTKKTNQRIGFESSDENKS